MKRSQLFVSLVVAAAMVLLAACAPAATPTPQVITKVETKIVEQPVVTVVKETVVVPVAATPAPKSLTYKGKLVVWLGGYPPPEAMTEAQKAAGATGNAGMGELIAEWEALHPGIDVVPVGMPTGPEGQDPQQWFVNTQIAAGQGADVYHYYGHTLYGGLAGDKGLFVPLDAYLTEPNPYVPAGQPGSERWVDLYENGFKGTLAQERSPAGHFYGVPVTAAPICLLYNKTALAKLGLTFPFPNYYSDLVALLQKLKEAGYQTPMSGGLGPASQWDNLMFDHSILEPIGMKEWDVLHYRVALVDGFIDPEEFARAVYKGLFKATGPEFKDILRLEKLWVPYWTDDWKTSPWAGSEDFINERALVYQTGPSEAATLKDIAKFEIELATQPLIGPKESSYAEKNPGPPVAGLGTVLHINWKAPERGTFEAALDFLQFITAPQNWQKCVIYGDVQVIKGVKPNLPPEALKAIEAAIPTSMMRFDISGTTTDFTQQADRKQIYTEYYLGQITLDEAANRFQKSLEAWVKRAIEANDKTVNPVGTWDLTQW